MRRRHLHALLAIAVPLLGGLAGCGQDAPRHPATPEPAEDAAPGAPAAMPGSVTRTQPAGAAAPAFAGRVWRVVASGSIEPGTTYAFHADGRLVVRGPSGDPPGHGRWRFEEDRLTIEEEGIAYPTDILHGEAGRLVLRSHNPGGTLEIELEPVPGAVP